MSIPSKNYKNDTIIFKSKKYRERLKELLQNSDPKTTFLPSGIEIVDIDNEFYDTFNNGKLSMIINGKEVPVIFLDIERWGEWAYTWNYTNEDKNLIPPYITLKKKPEQKGTINDSRANVPGNKMYTLYKIPQLKDNSIGYDMYKIPQPTAIDIPYEVRFITSYTDIKNQFIEKILKMYNEYQLYIFPKGHYIATYVESIDIDSTFTNINNERFFSPIININIMGYLLDENEFKKVEGYNKLINISEIAGVQTEKDITKISNENISKKNN